MKNNQVISEKKNIKLFMFLMILCVSCTSLPESSSIKLVSNVDMFDVGLAKINNDEHYDIYSINHVFAESILISENGGFTESGVKLGLSQTNGMPEYESTGRSPQFKDGLNIYSSNRKQLIVYCQNCDKSIEGTIKFPTPGDDLTSVSLIHKENADFSKTQYISEDKQFFLIIKFKLETDGLLVLNTVFMDINMEFKIDYPANSIYLGELSTHPKSNQFNLVSRDNHSFAWAKVDNNNQSDVFMTTGGLRAKISRFKLPQIINELFYINDPSTNLFSDNYKNSGIKKGTCRTYRSEWIDFDADGDLDLYLGCKNGRNLMHQQIGVGSGKFTEVSKQYNLGFVHADEFKWIDLNNDNNIDILTIQKNRLMVYLNTVESNNKRHFKKIKNSAPLGEKLDAVNTSIKTMDINNDSVPEIFVSTKNNIYYFENIKNKGYVKRNLKFLNLPIDLTGNLNIVDINLDGLLDLCVFNHGIYLQNSDNKFEKSELFPEIFIERKYVFKNILWFDSDINGGWDVINAESFNNPNKKKVKLLSYQYKDIKQWDNLNYHKNISKPTNNWLQIDLEGREFNRDAIGAKIILTTKTGVKQYRYNHGTNDSYHSQGHYRQYFGLGDATRVDIEVIWPDGDVTKLKEIHVNKLITIQKNS